MIDRRIKNVTYPLVIILIICNLEFDLYSQKNEQVLLNNISAIKPFLLIKDNHYSMLTNDVYVEMRDIKVKFQSKNAITFYESGSVESGIIAEDVVINGVNIRKGLALFYENGAIMYGRLRKVKTVDNLVINTNYEINFYESGRFKKGKLYQDTIIEGIKFRGGDNIVQLYESGKVMIGCLAEDVDLKICGEYKKINSGTSIIFDQQGNAFAIQLIKEGELVINNRKILVKFDNDYALKYISYDNFDKKYASSYGFPFIKPSIEINGNSFFFSNRGDEYDCITFFKYYDYNKKNISSILRLNDTKIKYLGITYLMKAWNWLEFDRDGNIIKD